MTKLFVGLTFAALAIISVSFEAHAGSYALDDKGDLFVVDAFGGMIFKYTPDGKKSTFASGLKPHGGYEVACDHAGNVFVFDYDKHSIFKFNPDGKKMIFTTGVKPQNMVFDKADNLFVPDYKKHSIFKFAPDGTKSTFATGCFTGPAFDKSGNLFVTENVSDRGPIFKFTPDGTLSTFAAPDRTSPDKKWEYVGENKPKIVEAGTNKVALDLSDQPAGNDFRSATVVWAPDSKRFAFNYGQQLKQATSLYQLSGDEWKALGSPDDKISEILQEAIAAQLKRKGLSEENLSRQKESLRSVWSTPKVINWEDSNTARMYASLRQVIALGDNPEMGDGFTANLLFTIKFDDGGNWKILKPYSMSQKEVDEGAKRQ